MALISVYVFLFGGIWSCMAQKDSLQNPYFKTYDDKAITSLYYLDNSNNFNFVFPYQGERKALNLIPNRREQIGASLSYKFLDISYGFSPQFFDTNKDNGKSKLFSLSTTLFHKKWMQTITFINQKGFYVSEENVELLFPNLRSTKIGGTTSYICNKNFSFKTITNQKEWQTKSSGSFIPSFSFYYTNIDLNASNGAAQSDILVFTLAPSYFYNLVINNHFLLSSGVSAGAGINDVDGDVSALYEFTASFKLGYNTDSLFAFAYMNSSNFIQDNTSKIQMGDSISTVKFTLGYRFNPPTKAKEFYDKASQKFGL